jgi:enamine deaminase RidA (YjgF/YER057c/UK114 family)
MIERVPSPSPYAPKIGFSSAVRAGETVYVAGTTAIDAAGECVGGDDPYAQAKEVLRKIEIALNQAGAQLIDVVQTRIFITDPADWPDIGRAHGEAFSEVRPAAAMLVTQLLDPRMRVEIEAVAYLGRTVSS